MRVEATTRSPRCALRAPPAWSARRVRPGPTLRAPSAPCTAQRSLLRLPPALSVPAPCTYQRVISARVQAAARTPHYVHGLLCVHRSERPASCTACSVTILSARQRLLRAPLSVRVQAMARAPRYMHRLFLCRPEGHAAGTICSASQSCSHAVALVDGEEAVGRVDERRCLVGASLETVKQVRRSSRCT